MPALQVSLYFFVSLCREVGNMLQEIPYNFTGKEAGNRGEQVLESADLASNPGFASLISIS